MGIPLAGYLVSRLGSRRMVVVSILGYAFTLFLIGLSSNIITLGVCLLGYGMCWNFCDIALNTQGIVVERVFGRTIMASFHGVWSLAACLGALLGFVMIVSGISVLYHFTLIATVILVITLISKPYLAEDKDYQEVAHVAENKIPKLSFFKKPEIILLQFGMVGLFALVVESAMFDWSGIYFESVLHLPKSLQIGFLVFMVMMTVGRFLTNYIDRLWGKQRVLQLAGGIIFIGFLSVALLGGMVEGVVGKVFINSFGFMLVGLGISCIVPTIYSLVGEKSATPVSLALTILSGISFIGSLIAPILVGGVTQLFSMQYAYMLIGLLGGMIVVLVSYCKAFRER
ncbi:MAG: MFS transporter [Tannerellaceae bacterium]|nr:MFS transporter [Tannerellaceae bacterium]